jgi:prefoldin subunit 5
MQKDTIDTIEAADGGDGSTFLTITFQDGSSVYVNPELQYDSTLVITFKDGVIVKEEI